MSNENQDVNTQALRNILKSAAEQVTNSALQKTKDFLKNDPTKQPENMDLKRLQEIRDSLEKNNNKHLSVNEKKETKTNIVTENLFKLTPEFKKKIRELPDEVKKIIFGQDETIDEVINIFKVAVAGLSANKRKPRGAFMFAGPSGCGKTETVLQLALLLGVPYKKFSMAEYSEENDVKKLIGAPPGYVGYEDGGQLTNFVNEHPYSIVILDEVEKADESLTKILLGVLDDGQLTDGKGMVVQFNNTIFVATTNLGAEVEYIKGLSDQEKNEYRMNAIKGFFRPEVLNRFDSINQFKAITKDIYKKIANKTLTNLEKDFHAEQGIHFDIKDHVLDFVADNSYDPAMGGRPAGRFVAKVLIKGIVDKIFEEGALDNVTHIVLDINKKGNIVFLDNKGKVLSEVLETKDLLGKYNQSKMSKEEEELVKKGTDLSSKIETQRKPAAKAKPSTLKAK